MRAMALCFWLRCADVCHTISRIIIIQDMQYIQTCFGGRVCGGYGNPQLTFARESHLDEIAEQLGMDPVELRLKNHVKVGGHIPGLALARAQLRNCGVCSKRCAAKAELDSKYSLKTMRRAAGALRSVCMAPASATAI